MLHITHNQNPHGVPTPRTEGKPSKVDTPPSFTWKERALLSILGIAIGGLGAGAYAYFRKTPTAILLFPENIPAPPDRPYHLTSSFLRVDAHTTQAVDIELSNNSNLEMTLIIELPQRLESIERHHEAPQLDWGLIVGTQTHYSRQRSFTLTAHERRRVQFYIQNPQHISGVFKGEIQIRQGYDINHLTKNWVEEIRINAN